MKHHNGNGDRNVQMRDDGVTERRKLHETATGIEHTYMITHKGNNHLIRFLKFLKFIPRVAWSETYIRIYLYIYQSSMKCTLQELFTGIMEFLSLTYYT